MSANTLFWKNSRAEYGSNRDFSEFSVCAQRNVFLACGVISTCAFPSLRRLALRPTPVFGWLPNGFTGLPVSNGEAAEKGLGGASIDTRLLLSVCSTRVRTRRRKHRGASVCSCVYLHPDTQVTGYVVLMDSTVLGCISFFFLRILFPCVPSWILLCCRVFLSIV